jgi:hypothetical protein
VHRLCTTRMATYVAFTFGMANDRRSMSGALGRGATPGNASATLVNTDVKSDCSAQSIPPWTWQTKISNCRSAE